jgi:hypothetical protein
MVEGKNIALSLLCNTTVFLSSNRENKNGKMEKHCGREIPQKENMI